MQVHKSTTQRIVSTGIFIAEFICSLLDQRTICSSRPRNPIISPIKVGLEHLNAFITNLVNAKSMADRSLRDTLTASVPEQNRYTFNVNELKNYLFRGSCAYSAKNFIGRTTKRSTGRTKLQEKDLAETIQFPK